MDREINRGLRAFLARNSVHPKTYVEVPYPRSGDSPFIVIKSGEYTMVVNPLSFDDHLCLDVHSFVGDEMATAGAFGMSEGRTVEFPETGRKSHGWPGTHLVAVLLGKQS